jgi:hypothetical protein
MPWIHAVTRPATEPYRRAWARASGGEYLINQNDPAPGLFRCWFTPVGKPPVFLGGCDSLRNALARCESDHAWGLVR